MEKKIKDSVNYIIELQPDITLKRLQPILYLTHAYTLALDDKPLSTEKFEAWHSGPTLKSVHNKFKNYKILTRLNGISELTEDEKDLIEDVICLYSRFSDETLSEHIRSTDVAYITARNGLRCLDPCHEKLSNELIKEQYLDLVTK